MNNYYRIKGYDPKHDFTFILDSHGMFEKKWQFSSYLIQRGLKVLEIADSDAFTDKDLTKAPESSEHLYLRASANGKPQYATRNVDGTLRNEIQVGNKSYFIANN